MLPSAPTAPDPVRSLPRAPEPPPAAPLPALFTPFLRAAAGLWLLLVVVVAQSLHGRLSDPDLWWHLKTGAVIAVTRHVPHVDPFSYSAAGKPWTAHEWLSELFLYGLWRAGGFAAVLWFRALMVAAIVAAMYFALRQRSGSYIAAIFLALGVALATSSFWSERPHLFTYLFFALLLAILQQAAEGRRAGLWVIPPLMLVWANLHGGYFSAFLLMGAVAAGAWLDGRLLVGKAAAASAALVRPLLGVLLLSVLAACVNPHGPMLLLYPFRYASERGLTAYVSEWQVPNVNEPLGRLFEVLLLALLGIGIGTRFRWKWRDVVPLLLFAHLALTASRHIPLFGLVAAGAIAGAWGAAGTGLWQNLRRWRPAAALLDALDRERSRPEAGVETPATRGISIAFLATAFIVCWVVAPKGISFRQVVRSTDAPVEACAWLQAHAAPGPIFNFYDYGGYLIYLPRHGHGVTAAPPPWKVLIDGRADLYGGAMMREYFQQAISAGPRWQDLLDRKYRADLVFWSPNSPLTRVLENRPEWEKVYPPPGSRDKQVVIFRRRAAAASTLPAP